MENTKIKNIKKLSKTEIKEWLSDCPYYLEGTEKMYVQTSGCCSPFAFTEEEVYGRCPDCGSLVNERGYSVGGCGYSPVECETCGCQGCTGAC